MQIRNPPQNIDMIKNINNIDDIDTKNDDSIKNLFYEPNPCVLSLVKRWCDKINSVNPQNLEVGPGYIPFSSATHFIDVVPGPKNIIIDINKERIPFEDNYFDFLYARHVLEDVQNPDFAMSDFIRSSKNGYIETPSPLVELTKGVESYQYNGYNHHRYIVWSDILTNTIYFLPKMPIYEYIYFSEELKRKLYYILNNYPLYWNNYFIFQETKPKIVIYNHGINYTIKESTNLIVKAIIESINNTNYFIEIMKDLGQ